MTPVTDPAARAAIFDGHRRLVAAFHQFGAAEALASRASPDLTGLRAAAAFLRQQVLPFCRWEEELLLSDVDDWEAAAFEHAFLAAEIDAFSRELDDLEEIPRRDDEARRRVAGRILRRMHRIDTVLELHMQRTEDRGIRVDARDGAPRE